MSSTVRPDNLRAALDAKLAAAMSQSIELREADEPRLTPHLNPREIVGAFLLYARAVYSIVDAFGKGQVGELQFTAWYGQWTQRLDEAERALWRQLRDERSLQVHGPGAVLIDLEISVAPDPAAAAQRGARAEVRKRVVRFAAHASRPASEVCYEYLRLTKRFADDFVRDHERFLP